MMNKHTITVELSATALKLSIETGDPFVIVAVAVVALFAFVVIAKWEELIKSEEERKQQCEVFTVFFSFSSIVKQ